MRDAGPESRQMGHFKKDLKVETTFQEMFLRVNH
jgi:hypothetical protein